MSFDIVGAIYNALKDFVTWVWQWVASAINWFVNTVINTLYNIFVSVLNTLMGIVNTITSWIWNSIRSLVILPAQSALQNALAFIQKKLFGTIYIASLVKLYEIQIKDFTEKPSIKKFLLLLAKPFLLYIGLSIMWGMLSGMGYMPTIQPTTPISPIPSTPAPTSGVQQLPTAPSGISISDVFRYGASAKGGSAYIQSVADSIRYGLNTGQSTPQQLPASYDALRYGITASVITNANVGGYVDNLRYSITANVVKPAGALPSDVVRNNISARGIAMANIRASDTVYSLIKPSIVPITTIKPIDVVNSQVVSQATKTAFIGAVDMVASGVGVPYGGQTEIYLFNTNDWNTASSYVTDGSIIFVNVDINTLTSDVVQNLVNSKRVVFVIVIDTQPLNKVSIPAFYPIFYIYLVPKLYGEGGTGVIDTEFQKYFGSSIPTLIDYAYHYEVKVQGTISWTGGGACYGYKRYNTGAIIEIPYDGFWKDVEWLAKYVDAISNILLGLSNPTRILYISGYTSSLSDWHLCYPLNVCWNTLAQQRGWRVIDLRTST